MNLQSQSRRLCPPVSSFFQAALGPAPAPDPSFGRHILACPRCRAEWLEIAADLEAASEPARSAAFRLETSGGLLARGFPGRADVPLRDGSSAVVHSTLVPWGRDYMIVELLGVDSQRELRVEKGEKNTPPFRISLYKDDRVVERFHLKKKHSWRLGSFQPGRYRLRLEEREVLAFQIVP